MFVITQHSSDVQILNYIKQQLGFGSVIKQGTNTHRFIVQEDPKRGIQLLVALFNGNLILPSKQDSFVNFLTAFNAMAGRGRILINQVEHIPSAILPSLSNAWLSGFTDSEGCFTISFLSNSNAFRIRYLVSQKWEINLPILNHLIGLFQVGSIEAHSIAENYSFVVSGLKACYKVYPYTGRGNTSPDEQKPTTRGSFRRE